MSLHVSSTCAHHQEVKIALHSLLWNKFCTSSWLNTEISISEFLRNVSSNLLSYTASVAYLRLSTTGASNHNDNYELKNITILYGIFCHSAPRFTICSEGKIKIFHLTRLFCHPICRPLDPADPDDCTIRPFHSSQLRPCRASYPRRPCVPIFFDERRNENNFFYVVIFILNVTDRSSTQVFFYRG